MKEVTMSTINETSFQENNMYFHLAPTDKFKTTTIVIKIKGTLDRDTVTKRALLSYMLRQGTKKLPTVKELQRQLADLYGATLATHCSKRGDNHIIHVRLEVANEHFIPDGDKTIEQALHFIRDLLFAPYLENGTFPQAIVEREKETLRTKQASTIDQKTTYANIRLMETMCKEERYRIRTYGYTDDLETIDADTLFAYYETMLQKDRIDVYVVGHFVKDDMHSLLPKIFSRRVWHKEESTLDNITQRNEVQKVLETEQMQQAKLHLGYRTNITYRDKQYAALQIFNGLFGGFPSSKLFMTVREEHSLAYYINSQIESFKGLLIVYCGIDGKEADRVIDLINDQFVALQRGEFSEAEVEEIKRLTISSIYETCDDAEGIVELLYGRVVANVSISLEQLLSNIESVTKEDIVEVAQAVELDTTYLLTNEGDAQHG